jgi:hypothetical protein
MATISRTKLLKELMPGIKALFNIYDPWYSIKKRKNKYVLIETYIDEEKVLAEGLTLKEAKALLNITTGEKT